MTNFKELKNKLNQRIFELEKILNNKLVFQKNTEGKKICCKETIKEYFRTERDWLKTHIAELIE